jgi:ribosomal protein S18 acetylase RimI-like enzyme
MLRHMTSLASALPREWRCDASTCAFVTDGAAIRVLSLSAIEAALVAGAKEQAEDLYRDLFELAKHPVARAKGAVARGFQAPPESADPAPPARTVLVYYDAKPEAPSDRLAAYTRVVDDGERVVISSIAVNFELTEDVQHQVLKATNLATEELANEMANGLLQKNPSQPVMIWRGQLGASDYLRNLFERDGYSTAHTDRLELTAKLKDLDSANMPIDKCAVEGVEIRPLDLANDDLLAVYDVVKDAYGPAPPSFAAWKRHYAQHPRFAADLSAVAWQDGKPVAVSIIELIVDGEGGGEEAVGQAYELDGKLSDDVKREALTEPLKFADDYEERKQKIRASAKVGYVCGVATVPALRGKRLGQTLLRHNFQAAARAGLDSIYLGTDRQNPAAVRAYTRAGMVETKSENTGMITAKFVSASP